MCGENKLNPLTLVIKAVIAIVLISMPSVVNAKQSGLTIVLKLKYSKLASIHPELYTKVRVDIGKVFKEYFNLKHRPSTIKITGLDIPVNVGFKVCTNNPKTDEGECLKELII